MAWWHQAITWTNVWLTINGVPLYSHEINLASHDQEFIQWYELEITFFKLLQFLSGENVHLYKTLNSLWPSDAIWRQASRSTLVQVMACCLMAPSHYLNQCWLIISNVLWHSSEGIIIQRSQDTNQYTRLKIEFFKSHPNLPGANELNHWPLGEVAVILKV